MLDELHVQNVALIEDAVFSPCDGLTVVTGETGAGKTALLSAIKLLVGERADSSAVRDGSDAARVEGRFFVGDEEVVAERRLTSDGRSRGTINGDMATVKMLAATLGSTVDLCGQHEHQHLLKPANHAVMLDAWAKDEAELAAYRKALAAAKEAQEHLESVRQASKASSAMLEEARFVLARIDEVDPREGEYEEVEERLPRVEHAEELASSADQAYRCISADGAALELVREAAALLDDMAEYDESLRSSAGSLQEASYLLEDVARDVRRYRDGVDRDPELLQQLQERMGAFHGLIRLWGPRMEDVLAKRAEAAEIVAGVDDSHNRLKEAEKAVEVAEAQLREAAEALDKARNAAAPNFSKAVNAQLGRLKMGGAEVVCQVAPLERSKWTASGPSSVEFMYRASEGMTLRPLARIASGGEISRVMLACKVVLGEVDARDTLVFDEVDAGVGGSVAVSLADVLADLAKTHQVIVVTHLPQVAVRADRHFVVSKSQNDDGMNVTSLDVVEGDDRVFEVARMLAGDTSAASLAHARELLAD